MCDPAGRVRPRSEEEEVTFGSVWPRIRPRDRDAPEAGAVGRNDTGGGPAMKPSPGRTGSDGNAETGEEPAAEAPAGTDVAGSTEEQREEHEEQEEREARETHEDQEQRREQEEREEQETCE